MSEVSRTLQSLDGPTSALLLLLSVLLIGSAARLVVLRASRAGEASERRRSLATWWALFAILAVAVLSGPIGVTALLTIASWLALREYLHLVLGSDLDHASRAILYLQVPICYLAVSFGLGESALWWLPFTCLVLIATSRILQSRAVGLRGFVRFCGVGLFGTVLLVLGLAHGALLVHGRSTAAGSGVGAFLFVVLLTELNDIGQALVGRRWGRHPIAPVVSPHKTWEGLLGGVGVTCVSALVLGSLLVSSAPETSLVSRAVAASNGGVLVWTLLAGLTISIAGFLGDLHLSAVKRDVGVDDSGDLLPGIGGVLDRVDSLTLTAPAFYWLFWRTFG